MIRQSYGKILAENDAWTQGEDGYWYYKGQLAPGATTESLLESVTLDKDTDMGLYTTTYKYCTTDGKDSKPDDKTEWLTAENGEEDADMLAAARAAKKEGNSFHVKKETALDEAHPGYADADYELEITIDMVQTTEDAVVDAWGEEALTYFSFFFRSRVVNLILQIGDLTYEANQRICKYSDLDCIRLHCLLPSDSGADAGGIPSGRGSQRKYGAHLSCGKRHLL